MLQLLLYPESDDSAQLSQVIIIGCFCRSYELLEFQFLHDFVLPYLYWLADWDWKTTRIPCGSWDKQASGMVIGSLLHCISYVPFAGFSTSFLCTSTDYYPRNNFVFIYLCLLLCIVLLLLRWPALAVFLCAFTSYHILILFQFLVIS